jgi:hypothetical protein
MSNENIGVIDQEGSMAQLLASAERELSAFVTAVDQLYSTLSRGGRQQKTG